MRSFNPDPEKLDQLEMICEFPECGRTFYTTNPRAAFCCDSHRSKHFRLKNKEQIERERTWNKIFKKNGDILSSLYQQKEKLVSLRELKLLGFDFKVMAKPFKGEDDRTCFAFFDFGIVHHSSKPNMFEIITVEIK